MYIVFILVFFSLFFMLMYKMNEVDGANGIRFNSARKKGAFTSGSLFSGSFTASASESLLRIPKTDINPNKAVFTIDSKSSNILIVNNKACQLLGYRPSELCDMKFATLLTNKTNKNYVSALAEGQLNSEDGTMVLLSGKVVEMNTKSGNKVAVSLWIRQIDIDGRCLAVAEPVERKITQITIDKNGMIVSTDTEALMLFQIDTEDELIGIEIKNLIPAIQLPESDSSTIPKSMCKQKATGKTKDNLSFPLCLMITAAQENSVINSNVDCGIASASPSSSSILITNFYVITIWVFQNISGLVVIDETGSIELCNHHFSMLMFGYSQQKITRMHITHLIPNFGKDFEYLGVNRSRNITTSSLENEENEESETETDPVYYEADQSFYATPTGMTTSEYSKSSYSMRNAIDLSNKLTNKIEMDNDNSIHEILEELSFIDYNRKKSRNNAIHYLSDMSKATSEPIQICLDDSDKSTIENHLKNYDIFKANYPIRENDIETIAIQSKNQKKLNNSVCKSMSENLLTPSNKSEKLKTDMTKQRNETTIKNSKSNMIADTMDKLSVKDDQTSNFDAHELLTPVNETYISDKYLMASDKTLIPNKNRCCHSMYYPPSDDMNEALQQIESDMSSVDFSVVHLNDCTQQDENNMICNSSRTLLKNQIITKNNNSASNNSRRHSEFVVQTAVATTTTPSLISNQNLYNDGKYKGEAIHCDGNVIHILYAISSQELPCGRIVYCVWICRDEYDLDADGEDEKHPNLTLTFNSMTSNVETSLDGGVPIKRNSMNISASAAGVVTNNSNTGGIITANTTNQSSRPNSVSLLSQCEDEQVSGEYSKSYTTLKQIGKGAFGYVKMAFRHSDRLLVVTKFILKEKLPPQFMVITDDKKEVPMEVYLLSTLKHPNIVTVLDVFENEKFFQLVMEKHGSGMDLFEFIDRRPLMDEQIGSYIFRQIVHAIDYLHSLKILHRDIKDENIIIDQYFHVKLIDFGSATFMEDGKLFSTFYGTTEYCSPEVLAGNKYAGPELEIWSLGR